MTDDLTKLNGPELAEQIRAAWVVNEGTPPLTEALRRLEEDDRVWQRRLEHERDGLREQCESWKRKARAAQAQIDRDDSIACGMTTAELVAEVKRARETRGCLISEVQQLKAVVANQRKELHTLNKERKATLTKLEDAQRRIAELEEGQRSIRHLEFCANGALAGIDERGCYQVASDGVRHEADPRYVLSVAAELIYSKLEANDAARARIAELEAQLRDAQNAGADEWAEDGEAVPEPATVVSTAALSAFEVAAANAADAMHVDANGLGFVKRAWLERHRGLEQSARAQIQAAWGAGPGTTPLSEPVERRYGPDARTVDDVLRCNGWVETTTHHLAIHLRETLATLKAVEALAEGWDQEVASIRANGSPAMAAHAFAVDECAKELREVLNGKR